MKLSAVITSKWDQRLNEIKAENSSEPGNSVKLETISENYVKSEITNFLPIRKVIRKG